MPDGTQKPKTRAKFFVDPKHFSRRYRYHQLNRISKILLEEKVFLPKVINCFVFFTGEYQSYKQKHISLIQVSMSSDLPVYFQMCGHLSY